MADIVEVKVSSNHVKNRFPIGDKTATMQESVKVERDNPTVQAGLDSGALEVVNTFQEEQTTSEAGSGDESDGEESEESSGEEEPRSEGDGEEKVSVDDFEYTELQEMASDNPDVQGNLPKDELFERLKEEGEL